jgi:hypothetical protein
MHPNARIAENLFASLNLHNADLMADCYHPQAVFRDITFHLHGKAQVVNMWRMICEGDIHTTFEIVHADDASVRAHLVDEYTFTKTNRFVRNTIESRLSFRDGLISEHIDSCDPRLWASMAIGGFSGFLAGRFRPLRQWQASRLLRVYVYRHRRSTAR